MNSETEVLTKIKNLLSENPKGMTTEDLAKRLPLNRTSTAKYLNTLRISGQIEQQVVGRAKLFKCSNRVPISQMLSFYSEAVIIMDHERIIREINPQFFSSFGIPYQDIIGKKFDTIVSEVDITHTLLPGICQAVDGKNVTKDHQIKKNDAVFYYRSRYIPVVLHDGPPGAAVILENITETRNYQEKLERFVRENTVDLNSVNAQVLSDSSQTAIGNTASAPGNASLQYITENLSDIIVEFDADTNIRYISPSIRSVLGYSQNEIFNGNILDLVHPDEQEKMDIAWQEMHASKKPVREEFRILHQDGHYVWIEAYCNPLVDDEGRVTGGITSLRDISDHICQTEALKQNCLSLKEDLEELAAKEQEIESSYIELSRQHTVLHKNEKLFHALFDQAYDALFLIEVTPGNTLGKFIEANETACRLLGYSRKDLLGISVGEVISRTPQSTILPIISTKVIGEPKDWFDLSYTRPDGKEIPVEALIRLISCDTHTLAMVAVREIKEREEAENALHESEERYQRLIEISPDAVIVHCEGTITFANPAAQILFGGSDPEPIIGKKVLDFVHPEFRETIRKNIQKDLNGERSPPAEIHLLRSDGTIAIIEGRGIRTVVDGKPSVLVAVRDITQRKKADEAQHESDRKFRAIIDHSYEFIGLMKPDGTLIEANRAALDLCGVDESKVLGKPFWDTPWWNHSKEMQERVRDAIKKAADGEFVRFEATHHSPQGQSIFVDFSLKPVLDEKGKVLFLIPEGRDITERKTFEEELQQSNHQLTLLTDITRHDILNRITAMMGYLSLAKKKFSDPEITALLATLESNTSEIKAQITFTQIHHALGTHEPCWVKPDEIIAQLRVPPQISLKHSLQGIEIYADPLLRQVFSNLLDNAERHGEHVTRIMISVQQTRMGLSLLWEDNGVGIPDDQKKKIFQRGFGKNTGLGLFLIREILGITGIKIREVGIQGSGAQFEIIVPKGAFRVCQQVSAAQAGENCIDLEHQF